MRNTQKIDQVAKIAISPIVNAPVSFRDQRLRLNEMFTLAVSNAPDNEIDNFTAKRLTPVFLAFQNSLTCSTSPQSCASGTPHQCVINNAMPFFIDYKEEVKRLISDQYEAAQIIDKQFEMTTETIVDNLRKVLPHNAVDDHLVYEALSELGFAPQQKNPLEFNWYFKMKKGDG